MRCKSREVSFRSLKRHHHWFASTSWHVRLPLVVHARLWDDCPPEVYLLFTLISQLIPGLKSQNLWLDPKFVLDHRGHWKDGSSTISSWGSIQLQRQACFSHRGCQWNWICNGGASHQKGCECDIHRYFWCQQSKSWSWESFKGWVARAWSQTRSQLHQGRC